MAADLSDGLPPSSYDEAVRHVWRPLARDGGPLEIVRAGVLAANSHNTQSWRFSISDAQISIRPDLSRRCRAVDPDNHHLYASLGCAAENMMQAAPALGFSATATVDTAADASITLTLCRRLPSDNALSDAIVARQCTRADYDARALSAADLAKLEAAGNHEGVTCMLVTDRSQMDAISDYVVEGNSVQMRDRAFMAELMTWIRFNDRMALTHRDGLTNRTTGNPSLPAWLARLVLPYVMTEKGEADKLARQISSSAAIAVFAASSDDKAGWIASGRAYQRFALQATALNIRNAFINQPVELLALRAQIASFLGLRDRRPDLIVRFGNGPTLPRSLRRPLAAVIEQL
ncbi:MAG: Tat pathway signal protein [Rhodospirillales bacterium]|nr:Tat pathway signal protein [Rhodospirillales bacterium]